MLIPPVLGNSISTFKSFYNQPIYPGMLEIAQVKYVQRTIVITQDALRELEKQALSTEEGTIERVIALKRIQAARSQVAKQTTEPKGFSAAYTVDIVTEKGRVFKNVPIIFPSMNVGGSGIYAVPQSGDLCLVGFRQYMQPMILGFYNPVGEFGDRRVEGLRLREGEIALVAPNSGRKGRLVLFQGGVVQLRASVNCLVELTPSGDTLSIIGRNIIQTWGSGFKEIIESVGKNRFRDTFIHELQHRRALSSTKGAGAFTESWLGGFNSSDLITRLASIFPRTIEDGIIPLSQTNINDRVATSWSSDGAFHYSSLPTVDEIANGNEPESPIDIRSNGTIDVSSTKDISIKSNTKIFIKTVNAKVLVEPEQITIDAPSTVEIVSGDNSIIIDNTGNITIKSAIIVKAESATITLDADLVNLGEAPDSGVAKAVPLLSYLTQIQNTFNAHTHFVNSLLAPTAAPSAIFTTPDTAIESATTKTE